MQLRKVVIRNFRGIREADWLLPESRFVCLVGPGDSTKTTLLDVIGLVLSARWNVQLTDADFYDCQVDQPIVLQVVIGDLPQHLLRDDAYGYDLSGIRPDGTLTHDPEDGAETCIIIQLKVTEALEPAWTVVRPDGEDDGAPISARARENFGLFRVDERVDTHLRWSRGSALTRLTATGTDAGAAVTSAHRAARIAVFDSPKGVLHAAAAEVEQVVSSIGGSRFTWLRPGLDPTSSSSTSALLLHDQNVPLTGHGLGSRRLTSLAIQEKAFSGGEILLIDEVEYGLEPHRLHYLLRHLKKRTHGGVGQVIMTTHSPLAVEALHAADVSIVRSEDGRTVVREVPGDLDDVQGTLRAGPSAVLARSVIVCEGKTEMGVTRAFLRLWDEQRGQEGKPPHAGLGVCLSNGQGSTVAPVRARILAEFGYPALLMIDNDDRGSDHGVDAAKAAGTVLVRWATGNALEDEAVAALSLQGLAAFVALAAELKDEQSVLNAMSTRLKDAPQLSGLNPQQWVDSSHSIEDIRKAVAATAKGKKTNSEAKDESKAWFKQEESGELLGELLINYWQDIKDEPIGAGLRRVYEFVYSASLP